MGHGPNKLQNRPGATKRAHNVDLVPFHDYGRSCGSGLPNTHIMSGLYHFAIRVEVLQRAPTHAIIEATMGPSFETYIKT
jgi:hypothetical protein